MDWNNTTQTLQGGALEYILIAMIALCLIGACSMCKTKGRSSRIRPHGERTCRACHPAGLPFIREQPGTKYQYDLYVKPPLADEDTNEIIALQEVRDYLMEQRDDMECERDEARTEHRDLERDFNHLGEKFEEMESSVMTWRTTCDELMKHRDEVQEELDDMECERDEAQEELEEMESERDDMESERDDMESERDDAISAADELAAQNADLLQAQLERHENPHIDPHVLCKLFAKMPGEWVANILTNVLIDAEIAPEQTTLEMYE